MKSFLTPIAVMVVLVLAGCATMNEAECVTADWRGIGYEDGASGRDASYIANRRSACADHGVTPNIDAYRQGYDDGIAYFCRPANGFTLGRSGRSYTGICPPDQSTDFVSAYNQGFDLYRLSSAIHQAGRTIEANEGEIESMRKNIATKEARLVSDGTPEAERGTLLREVRELEQEIGRLEAETLELERQRAVLSQEFNELEASYSRF